MSKKYEKWFKEISENWPKLAANQCMACGLKNGMQEVYNYIIKLEVFSYTIPVVKVCSSCEEVEFDGQGTILPSLADRCWRRQDRHANRDYQSIQARWTKRQLSRALRQMEICTTPPRHSKI